MLCSVAEKLDDLIREYHRSRTPETMAQKRRKFTAQFTFETGIEVLRGEKSVA